MGRLFLLSFLSLLISCTPVMDKQITEENKENIMKELAANKSVTDEERKQLASYIIRTSLGSLMSDTFAAAKGNGEDPSANLFKYIPTGKTPRQLIQEQAQFEKQEAARLEAERIQAEKEATAQEERRQSLLKPLSVSFTKRRFIQVNDFEKGMGLTFQIKNNSDKSISGAKGQLLIKDQFGDTIISGMELKIDETLPKGFSGSREFSWDYNQFIDEHNRLMNADINKMRIEWNPETIIFSDGSTLN